MSMDTQNVTLDRKEALALYRDYKKHAHWSSPIDNEIRRTYQLIAQGRVVIKALESIKAAGLNNQGYPKLAIIRATAKTCLLNMKRNGSAQFAEKRWARGIREHIDFPAGTFDVFPHFERERVAQYVDRAAEAIIPIIPIDKRPKRGLANYHILWEAEWERRVPVDPMLLRRIGKGDLWLVVAAWDLTEVERAALAARVSA